MAETSTKDRLTDRQRRFVEEYLVDLSAAAAAIRAGYSPKNAGRVGSRLKNLPWVRAAIERAMAARRRRTRITQDRVVEELARIAFADIREFVSWDADGVSLRASEQLTGEQTACVAEIVESPGKGGKGLRVKLHGKTQALALLARHLGGEVKGGPAGAPRAVTVVTYVPEPSPLPDASDSP